MSDSPTMSDVSLQEREVMDILYGVGDYIPTATVAAGSDRMTHEIVRRKLKSLHSDGLVERDGQWGRKWEWRLTDDGRSVVVNGDNND